MPKDVPFKLVLPLLFNVPLYNNRIVDLYVNDYISIYLNKVHNGIHKAKKLFNVITNTFNLFFSSTIDHIPNKLKRKIAISLCKLKGEGIASEIKKVLG